MKRVGFIFIYSFLFLSCNSNSEHYYYLTKEEALDVGYPYGSMIYRGLQEYSFSDILITSNVLRFEQTSEFAVVQQQLDIGLLRKWISESIASFIESNGYNGARKELEFYNYVLPDTTLLKYKASDSSINYLTNIVLKSSLIQKAR